MLLHEVIDLSDREFAEVFADFIEAVSKHNSSFDIAREVWDYDVQENRMLRLAFVCPVCGCKIVEKEFEDKKEVDSDG